LADHDIFSVRESAWRMCRDHTERLISQMEDTVRLADSRWQDSRRFAFDLFREQFADFDWTPELLVTLCDSVRPEVQQFGREMITRQFRKEQGPEILVRLSEHPSTAVQLFASTLLVEHAGNSLERLRELVPYFVTVLSRVNQGRVAKQRVWKFLTLRSKESEEAAKVLAHVFTRISATCAIGDRENALAAMASIQSRYPNIPLPIRRKPLETRG